MGFFNNAIGLANNEKLKELESKVEVNSAQLEQNKKELTDKINEVAQTGTTVAVIKNATEETINGFIEDGTMSNLALGVNSVTTSKIKNKSVTKEKTTFIVPNIENLYEVSEKSVTYTVQSGDTPTFTFDDNTIGINFTSGIKVVYIEVPIVTSNVLHTFNVDIVGNINNIKIVDSDKNTVLTENNNTTFIPTGTKIYIRLGITVANQNILLSNIGVYKGDNYNPIYSLSEDININFNSNYDNLEVFNKDYSNIFTLDNAELDKQFTSSGYTQTMTGWQITDFIKVDNSCDYYVVGDFKLTGLWGYYQTYDKNLNKLNVRTRFDLNVKIELEDDVEYIKLNSNFLSYINNNHTICFSTNNTYSKSGYYMNNYLLTKNNFSPQYYSFFGKKLCAYGDSNTGNKMWQQYVIDKFGFEYVHKGIGGTTSVGRCSDEELNGLPKDLDIFILNFGTNDISQGVPVGELPTWGIDSNYEFDTTTYIGALCKIIRYISVNIPKCRIIIMSPLYRSNSKLNQTSNEYPNFNKYIQGCKDIADRFGCEYIDLYSKLGINLWNYSTYFLDESTNGDGDTWAVHLNELGGKRVGAIVNKVIENLEPII